MHDVIITQEAPNYRSVDRHDPTHPSPLARGTSPPTGSGAKRYDEALALQEHLVQGADQAAEIGDTLLLVEHERVITLGRGAHLENVLVDPAELRSTRHRLRRDGPGRRRDVPRARDSSSATPSSTSSPSAAMYGSTFATWRRR